MSKIGIKRVMQLTGHSAPVYALEQGQQASTVFSGSGDNMIAEWNLERMEAEKFAIQLEATVYSICYIAIRHLLVVGQAQGGIHVIDLKARKEVKHFSVHSGGVFDLQYLPTTNCFYALSADGSFSVWDASSLSLIRHIPLCEAKLRSISFHPDGKQLAIACGDGTVRVFETELLNEIYTLHAHDPAANVVRYDPSGKFLLSGGRDALLKVWHVTQAYELVRTIPAHNYAIYSIVFDPTGRWMATGSRDKTIKLWDAATFQLLSRLDRKGMQGHMNSVNQLYWTNYHNYLVSTGDDRSLIVWAIEH